LKSMKKLLPYLVFSVILPILICMIFNKAVKHLNYGVLANMNYLMNIKNEKNDIIYIGSSRILRHIDPVVIDSVAGLKGYNLGFDDGSIIYINMVLCKYLYDHPTPKYVVIAIDQFTFRNGRSTIYNYADYQPYIADSMVSACLLPYYPEYAPKSLKEKYSLFQRTIAKPDFFFNIYKYLKFHLSGHDTPDPMKGFSPIDASWEKTIHKAIQPFSEPYTRQEQMIIQQMASICKEKGVKLIWICPPAYIDSLKKGSNYNAIDDSIQTMANSYHVPYWKYTDVYISKSRENFSNVEHLNAKGAILFSHLLGEDIQHYSADSGYVPDMKAKQTN
jgi:hypothetical protein